MKSRTFLILFVVVLLLGGTAYILFQGGSGNEKRSRIGVRLFPSLPMEKIDALKITSQEGTVTVSMKAGQWSVAERSDFPADFLKISSLVERISNLKVGRDLEASESNLAKLALHPPDAPGVPDETRGVRVEIIGSGQAMIDFLVGRERTAAAGSGGHYVLPAGSKMIRLVDQDLKYLDKKPEDWIQTRITDIAGKNVRQVVCRDDSLEAETVYALERPENDQPPQLVKAVGDGKVNPSKVDQLFDGLSSFEAVDVARASPGNDPAAGKRIEYQLYDKRVYTVHLIGPVESAGDQYAVRLSVMVAESDTAETVAVPEKDETPPQNADASTEKAAVNPAEVKQESDHFREWEFRVSKWSFDGFITNVEDLLEKDEKKNP